MNKYSIESEQHLDNKWFVQTLAHDFSILDVWEYPIVFNESEGDSLHAFQKHAIEPTLKNAFDNSGSGMFFHLRALYGFIFKVDKQVNNLPIPGCEEFGLSERISECDMLKHKSDLSMNLRTDNFLDFRNVYTFENETLHEISNSTEHTLMHYAWVNVSEGHFKVQMTAYVKHRNFMGTVYVKMIEPFRHKIVYPHLFDNYVHLWKKYKSKMNQNYENKINFNAKESIDNK